MSKLILSAALLSALGGCAVYPYPAAPVYADPGPVYYQPTPVYAAPPVYYGPPVYFGFSYHSGYHGGWHHH